MSASDGLVALVVDDMWTMRDLIGRMLRSAGVAEVVGAASADEALGVLGSRRVDLALVDWNLSGVAGGGPTGGELVQRIRARHAGLPILMITGETERKTVLAAREAGVDAYLVKPVSKADLIARVKFALDRRGAPPLAGS
jgi:two-component system chemotaxis response regulator CheY